MRSGGRLLSTCQLFGRELSTSGQFCSKVWSIPGLRIEWLRPDFMHMGITQYLSGNICWFMFSALGGRRHDTPLASRAVCAHIMNMADMAAPEGGLDRLHLNLTVRKSPCAGQAEVGYESSRRTAFLADSAQGAPALLPCELAAREGHGRMRRNPVRHLQGAQHLGHDDLPTSRRVLGAPTRHRCPSCTTRATTRTYGASTQSATCSCTCASPHSRRGSIRSSSGAR